MTRLAKSKIRSYLLLSTVNICTFGQTHVKVMFTVLNFCQTHMVTFTVLRHFRLSYKVKFGYLYSVMLTILIAICPNMFFFCFSVLDNPSDSETLRIRDDPDPEPVPSSIALVSVEVPLAVLEPKSTQTSPTKPKSNSSTQTLNNFAVTLMSAASLPPFSLTQEVPDVSL